MITEGRTTIDAGALVDSPAKAAATGLIDGAHIDATMFVRWLDEQWRSKPMTDDTREYIEKLARQIEKGWRP